MGKWTSVLGLLARELDGPGIHCTAGVHGPAEELSRRKLLGLARSAGDMFRQFGVEPGDRIVTLLPTGRALLQTLLGSWVARAAICIVAPSIEAGRSSLALDRLSAMLHVASPKVIVVMPDDHEILRSIALSIGARLLVSEDLPDEAEPSFHPENAADEIAFVQFTSGSTGLPKAIAIEHGQVTENIASIARRMDYDSTDTLISWMPIHHDFGLVWGLLLPIQLGVRLVLIPTDAFVRNPTVWLASIDKWRGTITAAPPYATGILAKPIFVRRLAHIDLSCLKSILLGAEPISAAGVQEFEETYASHGLRPGIVCPAYGMAEATLGISAREPYGPRRIAWIEKQAFHLDGIAKLVPARSAESMSLLSNGPPLDCFRVRVVNDEGVDNPEGVQGRILVSGPTLARRNLRSDESPASDGWFETGDLGFLLEGEIYISGRSKDILIRGGANVHAHEVEETVLGSFPDLILRSVAFALPRASDLRDEIVVGVELISMPAPEGLEAAVREAIERNLALQIDIVVPLPKGAVPRTTSGKIQRGRSRELYRAGRLGAKTRGGVIEGDDQVRDGN